MRAGIWSLIASVIAVGCATADHEPTATDQQGLAELHVDATPLLAAGINRVVVEGAGRSQDLRLNVATNTYDGTLFLPSGSQSLVASAFASDTLVAQSRPTSVDVAAGAVTRVVIRILDLSMQGPPVYGPIVDSLSFPTTTDAGTTVTFSISVVAPAGDPVSYAWISDCADSTFSAPTAATTGWSKPTQGACTITAFATSNGITTGQSFAILVFPAGTGNGAVNVSGLLVTAPQLFLSLPNVSCFVEPGLNASCPVTIASPATTAYQASVFDWGNSSPGTLELSDNCGGRFGVASHSPTDVTGDWLPPTTGGVCILSARAVNGDGLATTVTAAILTHPGTPATAQPPQLGVQLIGSLGSCFLVAPGDPITCAPFMAGSQVSLFGSSGWADGHPGSLTVDDDCAGHQPDPPSVSFFNVSWTAPTTRSNCTVTVHATNLEGASTDAVIHYPVVGP